MTVSITAPWYNPGFGNRSSRLIMARTTDAVEVERAGDIAILRFNRPKNLNAISIALAQGIATTLIELDSDDTVKGIVLTGSGERAFCAGIDLMEARGMQVADIEQWFGTACNVYKQILLTNKPVIAAINGIAAGGGFQIAMVSDLRVAHPGARLGQPEINAAIPSIMGSYWMSLHLGWSKNQELSMTGRLMEAAEAEGLGLINYMVEQDQVVSKACEVARTLAGKPAVAWARTKARFREIALAGFDEAFRAGVLGQQESYAKGEAQAIIEAFLASRGAGKS
ncbi:MAG: enoyl-CoA hydratase [Rhodospirillaceae bacterium]|nr:enoyl-CoA hydratase [Rhodospirillaceae bacterium]